MLEIFEGKVRFQEGKVRLLRVCFSQELHRASDVNKYFNLVSVIVKTGLSCIKCSGIAALSIFKWLKVELVTLAWGRS